MREPNSHGRDFIEDIMIAVIAPATVVQIVGLFAMAVIVSR